MLGVASTSNTTANVPLRYEVNIANHALANDIPLSLAGAIVKHESAFDPDATGQASEIGLIELGPHAATVKAVDHTECLKTC